MALYIDTAVVGEVERLARIFPIAGVTTNPSLLLAAVEGGQRLSDQGILTALLELVPGAVFMQPVGATAVEIERAARGYIARDPARVVPKLPMSAAGIQAGIALKAEGARIAFTATMAVAQAYCAVAAGADWIIPYYGRLRRAGDDPCARVAEMRELIRPGEAQSRILVASLKSAADVSDALEAGAHDITVAPAVIETLTHDPLTDDALAQFTADWQRFQKLAKGF